MSSQNSNTKTLFRSAVKNTGKFLGGLFGGGSGEVDGPNPHTDSGISKRSGKPAGTITKFLRKFKGEDGYANSRQAYQNYLKSHFYIQNTQNQIMPYLLNQKNDS